MPQFIPVLIYKLTYNSKMFLSWLLKLCDVYERTHDLNNVPKNNENYNIFSIKV